MRSLFTTDDIKFFLEQIFANEEYNEKIILTENGEQKEIGLADYLGIDLYSWKDRVAETDKYTMQETPLETYIQQLNESVGKIIGLVEYTNNMAVASQDIDSGTLLGRITFLVDSNKIKNLDYFMAKVRNGLLGVSQEIINRNGDTIKAYINLGVLIYEGEPTMIQIGEVITCSANFEIKYLNNSATYNDIKMELSFDNATYFKLPYIRSTMQRIMTNSPLARQTRPDITGFRNSSISNTQTISFYDFNDNEFLTTLNDLFWTYGAIIKNNAETIVNDLNKPIYIKIETNNNTYIYKNIIDNIQKDILNNDFVVTSITLKGDSAI